jgi:hypothetical protein
MPPRTELVSTASLTAWPRRSLARRKIPASSSTTAAGSARLPSVGRSVRGGLPDTHALRVHRERIPHEHRSPPLLHDPGLGHQLGAVRVPAPPPQIHALMSKGYRVIPVPGSRSRLDH